MSTTMTGQTHVLVIDLDPLHPHISTDHAGPAWVSSWPVSGSESEEWLAASKQRS